MLVLTRVAATPTSLVLMHRGHTYLSGNDTFWPPPLLIRPYTKGHTHFSRTGSHIGHTYSIAHIKAKPTSLVLTHTEVSHALLLVLPYAKATPTSLFISTHSGHAYFTCTGGNRVHGCFTCSHRGHTYFTCTNTQATPTSLALTCTETTPCLLVEDQDLAHTPTNSYVDHAHFSSISSCSFLI